MAECSPNRKQSLHEPALCYLEGALAATESKDFSFDVLVDIHSTLGLLYDLRGNPQTAVDYYMTALWLLHKPFKRGGRGGSFFKGYDLNTHVAINLHRLGTCYGKLGQKERMQDLYDRAECFLDGDIFISALT